jgi:nucleotide-binding universal stress UspA family protein
MDRIVVGVDGTPGSVAAARYATGLAGKMGFNVTLAFVVPSSGALGLESLGASLEWERDQEERGRRMLREVSAACELAEDRVERLVLRGDAATELVEVARRSIMLVVGHRHRGALSRTLLGSVAARLAQISPLPLLVVPEAAP